MFHDANLAGHQYEHCITACHTGYRYAASSQRDVLTPPQVMAMVQTDLPKAPCDGTKFPVARNLQKAVLQDVSKRINHLVLPRAVNILLLLSDLSSPSIKNALSKITVLFTEDGVNKPAMDKRWKLLLEAFHDTSTFVAAVKCNMPQKRNGGNPNARGMKKQEKEVYNLQLNELKALALQDPTRKFWLRLNKNNKDPPNE